MKSNGRRLAVELVISGLVAAACAFSVSPAMMGRIDEMLVTFLSIVLAAVIPGIALTASAARPSVRTPLEARQFGKRLEDQVGFWFGFLWTGGLAVTFVVVGRALDWRLVTVRPNWTPGWVPEGHAWLVFMAVFGVIFVAVRARHVVTAIQSLIAIGTDLHAEQVGAKLRDEQAAVRNEIAALPRDEERGAPTERRPRH